MPEAQAQVILAFDYGLRRIGIAAGDTISGSAAPCATLQVGDWRAIDALLRKYQPAALIVGIPHHADGSPSALAGVARDFAQALHTRSGKPVHRTDEFGSSIEASEALKRARQSGQRRQRLQRADIDSAAAAIILQRWLDGEGRIDD